MFLNQGILDTGNPACQTTFDSRYLFYLVPAPQVDFSIHLLVMKNKLLWRIAILKITIHINTPSINGPFFLQFTYIFRSPAQVFWVLGVSSMVGFSSKGRSVFTGSLMIGDYPLVNIQKTIENHHF